MNASDQVLLNSFAEYTRQFVYFTALYEMDRYGKTELDNSLSVEKAENTLSEYVSYINRIEGWRETSCYREYVQVGFSVFERLLSE